MYRHQRTLVALSGTATDRAVVDYARLVATLGFARHFHFVHVRTPSQVVSDARDEASLLAACEELVGEVFVGLPPNVSTSCHVLVGVRIDQLIEFIVSQQCDMVVLGHRRARSGQRSLARRLAMVASCSVLMVPEGAPISISEIMAPVDFSDHSADAARVAAAIAQAAGLRRCVVAHVFSDPSVIRYDEHTEAIRGDEQAAFDKFIAPIDSHGVRMEPHLVEGNNVAGTILHAAKQRATDLLVMSTRGRSRAASILLGSVTNQVMTESPVAVLAVKHFGAMMHLFQALKEGRFWTHKDPKTN